MMNWTSGNPAASFLIIAAGVSQRKPCAVGQDSGLREHIPFPTITQTKRSNTASMWRFYASSDTVQPIALRHQQEGNSYLDCLLFAAYHTCPLRTAHVICKLRDMPRLNQQQHEHQDPKPWAHGVTCWTACGRSIGRSCDLSEITY